jgi:hypothetical protein
VETLQGQRLPRALNGRYLKTFHPSVWQNAWQDMADLKHKIALRQKMAGEVSHRP